MMLSALQVTIIACMLLMFVVLGVLAVRRARQLPLPAGALHRRGTELGNEVVVIDAPGSNGEQMMLIEACATATLAAFTAWHRLRPADLLPGQPRHHPYPIITVHFIDDKLMDELETELFDGEEKEAYLSDASSAVQHVPLIVIRKSCARELVTTGQPMILQVTRSLMAFFQPEDNEKSVTVQAAYELVQNYAREIYKERFRPEDRLKKHS